MKGWQVYAGLVAVVGLLAVLAYVFQPGTEGGPMLVRPDASGELKPVPTPVPSNLPDRDIKGSTSMFTGRDPKDGHISWTLRATSIVMREVSSQNKADAHDITCTFYNKEGQPVATVSSRGCTVNLGNNNLQFHGRVKAVDPVGQTLTVENLRYDGKVKRFFGHGGVRMTRATSVIIGDKVWADPNLKVVQLDGNVRAYVRTLAVGTPAPVAPPTVPPAKEEETPDPPPSGAPQASMPRPPIPLAKAPGAQP